MEIDMENSNSESQIKSSSFRKDSFRKGSFRLGGKDQTVIELGSFDTQRLLLEGGGGGIREKQKLPKNTLSLRQMKSLTALTDTILPSINDFVPVSADDESAATFYRISASMAGTPERVYFLILYLALYSFTPLFYFIFTNP
jgi:long-chain-alcohol oxidase